jgi:hypothetical protein
VRVGGGVSTVRNSTLGKTAIYFFDPIPYTLCSSFDTDYVSDFGRKTALALSKKIAFSARAELRQNPFLHDNLTYSYVRGAAGAKIFQDFVVLGGFRSKFYKKFPLFLGFPFKVLQKVSTLFGFFVQSFTKTFTIFGFSVESFTKKFTVFGFFLIFFFVQRRLFPAHSLAVCMSSTSCGS